MRSIYYLGAPVLAFVFCAGPAHAGKKHNQPTCTIKFSILRVDILKNVTQGLPEKDAQWFQKKIEKKYPDVCYVPPTPDVQLIFLITVAPAEYHGTQVETHQSTHEDPVSGTVTDEYGQPIGTYDGTATTTTTTSTAVPYSFQYGIFTLGIETKQADGKWIVRHRFQQQGIYNMFYGIPLGGRGHHPVHAVIEDAAKWLHNGGLANPLENGVAPQ